MSVLQARPGFFADRERTGVRSRGEKSNAGINTRARGPGPNVFLLLQSQTLFILSLYTEFSFRTALRNSRRHVGLTVNK